MDDPLDGVVHFCFGGTAGRVGILDEEASDRMLRVRCISLACLFLCAGCADWLAPVLTGDESASPFNDPTLPPTPVEAEGAPLYERRALFDAIPGKSGSHAATITSLADGELLAAWYSYDGPHELTGSAIYMSRLRPGETAWQTPWLHADRPEGDGNPVLYCEGDRVWLFQAVIPGLWSTAHIEMQRSEDRGVTWGPPVVLPGPIGANVRFPPVRTLQGWLLLPAYDDLLQRPMFYRSVDGLDWELLGVMNVSPSAIQPSVVLRPDGRLLGVLRNRGGGWLWVSSSADGGLSWSPPEDGGFANPDSPAALCQLDDGNLVLVFNDSSDERIRLTAAMSGDGGATWPHRRGIAEEWENGSYPSITSTPDGLVHVVFSAGRERIDHVSFNEAWLVEGVQAE